MKKATKKQIYAAFLGMAVIMGGSPSFAEEAVDATPVFSLQGIVVTANRTPQKKKDVNADISVISRQEIEQMHMTNVEEALRTIPGVQFTSYGGNGGMNANLGGIRLNGSKEVVVLVDGVKVSEFQNGGFAYGALTNNMDNIERIEVVRGSAGALYGSGAKGGVINIITRKIDTTKTTVDVSAGSFSTREYKLSTTGKQDKVGYHVYYDRKESGDFKDGDGTHWDSDISSTSYGAKVDYEFTPTHKVTMNFDQTKSDFSGRDMIYHNDYKGKYKTNSFTLRDDAELSSRWKNSVSYRQTHTTDLYMQNGHTYDNTDNDFSYRFLSEQATYTSERHTLVMGVDYVHAKDNHEKNILGAGSQLVKFKMRNTSYYVQDDWKIFPQVTLTGGLRHDRPSASGGRSIESHTAKSYKLTWDITEKDKVYAGRSDFFILPTMEQLTDTRWGNISLKPGYGRTTSIGYTRAFSSRNSLSINWFETISDRTISLSTAGYINSDGVARGWNAEYDTDINDHWKANFGWSHLFQYAENDTFNYGYYPKDMATFGIYYNNEKFNAGLDGYYFMRRVNPKYPKGWPVDNYPIFNLSASYTPKKDMNVYVKINNLFDKMYAERTHVIYTSGRPGDWYSMPGRSIIAGIKYSF